MIHLKRFSEYGYINEALPRDKSVKQLKMLRAFSKKTDIGDRIPNLVKGGANVQWDKNIIDSGIESYEDWEKSNKKFIPSWNLKGLLSPYKAP